MMPSRIYWRLVLPLPPTTAPPSHEGKKSDCLNHSPKIIVCSIDKADSKGKEFDRRDWGLTGCSINGRYIRWIRLSKGVTTVGSCVIDKHERYTLRRWIIKKEVSETLYKKKSRTKKRATVRVLSSTRLGSATGLKGERERNDADGLSESMLQITLIDVRVMFWGRRGGQSRERDDSTRTLHHSPHTTANRTPWDVAGAGYPGWR